MAYLKPQSPLQHKDGDYFYPLTTIDQVIMEDGSRLNSVFKHTVRTNIILSVSNWSSTAPYTQTITLDDYLDNLKVDANIVYSGIKETDLELNKAASCLSYIKKNSKNVIFYCLSSKPEIDIPVEIFYESLNNIATVGTSEKIDLDDELAAQAEIIAELQETLQSKMGGGDNNLNFEIIGGTIEPGNPSENMIWVNTEDEITSWVFSVIEPEEPSDGMVWFVTDTPCAIDFNALKKNGIQVYPLSASMYIDGEWVKAEAEIYQNGEWIAIRGGKTYIFKDGEFISGSWDKFKTSTTIAGVTYSGNVALENKELHLKATAQTKAIFYTTEKFNTRGKTGIVFTISKITNTNKANIGKIHVGIASTKGDDSFVAETFVDAVANNASQEIVVPIQSAYYGDYYIKAGLIRDVMYEDSVYISEICLE